MKWYDDSYNNIKVEKIPYRLLRVNDEIYDSIFERNGEYYLSIKCGVSTYFRNHGYENFVTDGFKMIYELPREQQKEVKIDLSNIENFLQEHKTVISSIPGSDISLNAIIETEYIAHRELDQSVLIKYDNYSLKDFPMETRNYNENIVVERLINNTEKSIGYQKEDKYYFDITENRNYIKVVEDGIVNNELKTDGNSIELPSELGNNIAWQTEQSANIVIQNTVEGDSLKLVEIWGDAWQDTSCGKNLYDDSLPTTEGVLLWNSGGIYVVGGYITTSFIEIEPNTSYTFSADGIDQRYCLFDKNQKYISGAMANTFSSGNASYVRLSGNSMRRIQLEKGINATAYEPYCQPNFSNIQHVGELYTDSRGRSILDRKGNEQYKIEIESHNDGNLFDGLMEEGRIDNDTGLPTPFVGDRCRSVNFTQIETNTEYYLSADSYSGKAEMWIAARLYGKDFKYIKSIDNKGNNYLQFNSENARYVKITALTSHTDIHSIILVQGKSQSSYKPTKIDKTTILLPCQLSKVGDVADKLYWDEKNNKYIVEKKIKKIIYPNYQNTWMNFSINNDEVCIASNGGTFSDAIGEPCHFGNYLFSCKTSRNVLNAHIYFYFTKELLAQQGYPFSYEGARKYLIDSNATLYLQLQESKTIETIISEQKTLNCYNDIPYVKLANTNLSPIIKVKAPVNVKTSNQIFLSRENNFDSIFNVVLNPDETSNITLYEGGLDLKLTNGIEIINDGKEYVSNQDGKYASNDFIDLASYTSSPFTIDTMDIPFDININKFTIFYYNANKEFIGKSSIPFGVKFYKSHIEYPNNTQYCKVSFSKPNIISDYYKIRILRDKTKTNGFQTIKKTFNNTNNYTKSFSSIIPIKHDIERLVVFFDNYSSIKEFNIINNLDKNQKMHSFEIPRKLEPGETLSYTRSGKKQFLYKSNSTPYNSITNVSYIKPYKEYSNIANKVEFILFKDINSNNGTFNTSKDPYCATEQYINVSAYQGKTITLSVASLMSKSYIYFYNEQQGYINRVVADNNFVSATVPNNAHYIRCGTYLNTLAAQTPETKELIQKHVMVTLSNVRCDYVPYGVRYSHTIIPEEINTNSYGLNASLGNRYLFVKPYQFEHEISSVAVTTPCDGKWSLKLHHSSAAPSGGYATLDSIKDKTPTSSSTITTPTLGINHRVFEYTKYVYTGSEFVFNTTITPDEKCVVYINNDEVKRYSGWGTYSLNMTIPKGISKITILIVNESGSGGLSLSQDIPLMSNSSSFDLPTISLEDKFNVTNFFNHDIVDGKLLTPKEDDLNLMLNSAASDKFIFAKDFTVNPDKVINGCINANAIKKTSNSKTYINRVYGGETNLTLLTVGGNVCEIYFLNDYFIEDNSHYTLYAKYTSGNQKIKINKVPDNARYIAIVTDKQNEDTLCSHIFLFPGDLTRSIDTTSSKFEMFDDFNKEIATLPYSSEITILKNKLPDLSKLISDSTKYIYDDINNRFVFPIKIEKNFTSYYLQYWTKNPNNMLNIFIDSTKDIVSETKQFLCRHADEAIAVNNLIEINNDILTHIIDDTLYLSISIENGTRLSIYNFLIQGSYQLQLEKDVYTNVYEPYTEQIEHHPMYLTANGLTIESSSSYYGIRKLEPPQNIVSVYDNGLTNITWDEVVGATSYILYLDNIALHTVYTSSYETMAEMKGMLTIKAKNSVTESKLSEAIFVHSVPTNPYIVYIDNEYKDKEYKFTVHFQDNSDIETGYKVRYQIDTREEKIINLEPAAGIGSIIKTSFSAPIIQEQAIVRITAVNDKGENAVASQFILKLMPDFVWAYDEDNNKIILAWDNKYPEEECSHYVIRYKKKNDEAATTIKLPNKYGSSPRIRYSIDLDPEDEMELSLSALKEDIYYIFTKPKKVSKELDKTKTPPSNFTSRKVTNDTVVFSWIDNSTLETGWELVYALNNGSPETIRIPTQSKETENRLYEYEYKFSEHGFMTTKLRTVWELNTSYFTEEITDYYFPIENKPPAGLKKQYESKTSMLITWEPQSYVESYNIVIEKNGVSETINTKDNSYIINLNDKVIEEYRVKVRTNFLGDQHSGYTETLKFKPTFSDNKLQTTINTKCKEEYDNVVKKINKNQDSCSIATRSTNKVSWSFLFMTASLNQFQTYEGLISTETWNTGQKTEYNNAMIIKTANVKMCESVVNTISYQNTEYDGDFKAIVYTPSTISGKIEMEINKTRIVCIGDSITAGHPGFWAESMTGEITHQYPYWLDRRLKFQYEVINKGYGSDRTYNVLNRFQKDVLDLSPQYCLIQIGTNDIYWGAASADGSIEAFDSSTLADMKKNVMTMVELCFQNNIVPILGMLIPRTQVVTDPVVKHGLYAFNDWIMDYANTTEGLNYVDFFNAGKDKIPATPLEDPKSPGAMNPIYDGDNVYDEQGNLVKYGAGIHLNAIGYRIMAEAIPLNLFTTIESGVKMYMDEKCTIEADYNTEDKQNPFYEIEIEGMKLTRTKKIIRYIKNVGNTQALFSVYPNDLYNLDYNFKFKDTDEGSKSISGILTPGNSTAIRMELTPLTEDSKSSIELSLVSREFSIGT